MTKGHVSEYSRWLNLQHAAQSAGVLYTDGQAVAFRERFGQAITRFWGLTGFDVIAFDVWIKPADGESTADAVTRRYGVVACDLVRALIGGAQ